MRAKPVLSIAALLTAASAMKLAPPLGDAALLAVQQAPAMDADRQLDALARAAALEPSDASLQHRLATFYFQKSRDPRLNASEKRDYLERTVAAEERALAADPYLLEAVVYKSLSLRELAAVETDAAVRRTLLAESDALQRRAAELGVVPGTSAARRVDFTVASPPPPPPPVDGAGDIHFVYAETSFTATGNARTLEKVKDVRPVFPPVAVKFGVQGTVVIEADVDSHGHVIGARVVESVPLLDQAAIDAVRQWQFDPATATPLNDRLVLTVRARFIPPR